MSAAATAPGPTTQPAPWPARTDRRGCLARLLGLVRKLIDHGKQLAAAVGQRSLTDDPVLAGCCFGTQRHRADPVAHHPGPAARHRARGQAAAQRRPTGPETSAAARAIAAPSARPTGPQPAEADPRLAGLPTAEQIAAEIRRRPVGAVIADICRDLGIMADHPLWRELHMAIMLHGGNLAGFLNDMFERTRATRHERMDALYAAPAPAPPPALEPASTGPP